MTALDFLDLVRLGRMEEKQVSVRLPSEVHACFEKLAQPFGVPLSHVIVSACIASLGDHEMYDMGGPVFPAIEKGLK